MTIGCIRFHCLCVPYFFYSGVPMAHKIRVTVLKCFSLFQFHTIRCFNNIMIYFMSLFGVYSTRILSTVAMLVTCEFNRGFFFFLSHSVHIYLFNESPILMFLCCSNLLFSTYFFFPFNFCFLPSSLGPGVAQWLRRCATSRKVPGSIRGGVTGFFSDIFPSDRTMALGSTQSLVKMSTRNVPGGKGGRCVRLTTYHHTVPLSRNLGALTSCHCVFVSSLLSVATPLLSPFLSIIEIILLK